MSENIKKDVEMVLGWLADVPTPPDVFAECEWKCETCGDKFGPMVGNIKSSFRVRCQCGTDAEIMVVSR